MKRGRECEKKMTLSELRVGIKVGRKKVRMDVCQHKNEGLGGDR